MQGGAVLFVCCVFTLMLLPVVLFLLTYIFRVACVISGLPKPSVLSASGIMLINTVADAVAFRMLETVVHEATGWAGIPRWEAWFVAKFLYLPIDLVISAGLHAAVMGIKFGKGIEVWFVQRLIMLGIVASGALVTVIYVLARG